MQFLYSLVFIIQKLRREDNKKSRTRAQEQKNFLQKNDRIIIKTFADPTFVCTVKQEQIARFAKAMGHPARIAILQLVAKQATCYFGNIHEVKFKQLLH